MNIRIYFRNYIVFFSIVYVSSITIKKESHFHNKWLVVNLTCLDETGGEGEENLRHFHKRSVSSSSDVLKGNDVVSSHGNDQLFKKVSSKKVGDEFSVVNESSTAAYEASNATNLSSSAANESSNTVNESFNTVNESSITVNESSITSNESFNAANDSAAILNNESYHSSVNDDDIARTSIIVNCNSFDLEPDLVPSSVKHLRIKSSGLIGLPSEWTRNLSNLSVLNINAESGLIFPSNDSCSWLPDSISTVDLTQTTLKTLSVSDCPTSLKKLYLQGTSLEELTLCLDYLEELDASWNLLKEGGIEKGCEDATKNLKALKLHNNEMTYWSPCGWPSLTHVELQKNEISRIDFNACVPNNIVEINLSNNKLKQQPHPLPSKLTSIKLSHNLIEESFHFPQTVQRRHRYGLIPVLFGNKPVAHHFGRVDMSHNALTHIGKRYFSFNIPACS
ncbi:hypothetical protein Avbf_16159 [Armadillidium vulgare]|nr:hypothetical protein Avbf_16159 [Armadillidium vulgare]